MPEKPTIGLDYSHKNKLTLEASSYNEFTHFLFSSGYKLGKIQAGFDSVQKLEGYNVIILSTPNNSKLTPEEIDVLEEYVRKGGSLILLSSLGGDHGFRTNLNDLANKFGFEFASDQVHDSMNYVNLQKRPLLTNITPHVITEHVRKLVFSSACSLNILGFLDEEKDKKIDIIATGGLNTWRKIREGKEWVEEDCPKIPLIVSVEYHEGKVVGFGNLSMFSSLGREYGFSAFDNNVFIANTLKWLTSDAISEGKVLTVNLNLDLFYWANKILEDQNWENLSDIINVSLKYFKDNYKGAIDHIKKMQEEKQLKRKEYEKKKLKAKEESSEDKILDMIPIQRKKEDLEDIMSALEEVTGEKYEISIDLEEEIEKRKVVEEKIVVEEKTVEEEKPKRKKPIIKTPDGLEYTSEDTKEYHRQTSKNAIWHGKPTKAFLDWLKAKKTKEKISSKIEK